MSRLTELRERVIRRLETFKESREPRHEIIWGLLGDAAETVTISGQAGKVNVRLLGNDTNVVRAWNSQVPPVYDLRVDVEVERQEGMPNDYTVLGVAKIGYAGYIDDERFFVPPHHATHEYPPGGESDIVNVYNRALAELRADAQATPDMTVHISAGFYLTASEMVFRDAADSPAFAAAPGAGTQRHDLLYLNTNTNQYAIEQGDAAPVGFSVRPWPVAGQLPIAWVWLQAGDTAITDDMIIDARVYLGRHGETAIAWVGDPTYKNLQDWVNTTQSAGLISGGTVTATSYAIDEADDVAETFTIVGDVSAYFTDGVVFTVSGSTGNDGDYTTVGNSVFGAGVTTITVADVPDGTDDGDIADGRVDVTAGTGMVKKTDDEIDGVTAFFDWPATTNILLADNDVNWLYVTYGAGTPAVAATATYADIDFTTEFEIAHVYRESTDLHILQAGMYIYNLGYRKFARAHELREIELVPGTAHIADEGTLHFSLTEGVLYSSDNRFPTAVFDSSGAERFRAWYHDGGGNWTSTARDQATIDSAQYDTGTGLAALAANRYGVYWVFLHTHQAAVHVDVVYGVASYRLSEAQVSTVPPIPDICADFAVIVGRIIAYKDAAEITEAACVCDEMFVTSVAADHSDLSNLELITGGHTLTSAQWRLVGASALNTLGLLTPSADVSSPAEAILKSNATGDLTLHDLTATGQLRAGAGIAEGLILGADAQWYRSAANVMRTPDKVHIDVSLSVGTNSPGTIAGQLRIWNETVNTTDDFVGLHAIWSKTAGATDINDDILGESFTLSMNDIDSTIGNLIGTRTDAWMRKGTIGSDGNDKYVAGLEIVARADGGTIWGSLVGASVLVSTLAAVTAFNGYIAGVRIAVDSLFDPTDSVMLLYLYPGTNVDYGIYQEGGLTHYFGVGRSGFGADPPLGMVHIDQTLVGGAIPVLLLDQADISEEFLRFIGASADGVLTQSLVEEGDQGSEVLAGWAKIYVEDVGAQIAEAPYYVPFYTLAA